MVDTLTSPIPPGRGAEFGDTIFESLDSLGVVEDENLLTLNLGPQHPSTHGVFRMVMQLQGETVIGAIPVMGYLHRSSEKLGEARTYVQGTVLTDRMDYLSPITTNWAYALSIERLTGLVVPERAEYLRVITGELSRIQSHLVAVGTFGMDVGTYGTPLLYALRERESVLDLLALPTGVRMNPSYIRYGGVARDAPPEFFPAARALPAHLPVEDRRVRSRPGWQRGLPQPHGRRGHDPARSRPSLQRDGPDPARQRHRI